MNAEIQSLLLGVVGLLNVLYLFILSNKSTELRHLRSEIGKLHGEIGDLREKVGTLSGEIHESTSARFARR